MFEAILNASDAGIAVFDRAGIVKAANRITQSRAKIGYGVDLTLGSSIYDIVLPRDRRDFDLHVAECLEGEAVSFIKRLELPNRPDRRYRFTFTPVSVPGEVPWGVCLAVRDMEPQLTMKDEFDVARYVMDQSPASVVITDTDGDIEYVNPRFSEITGYSAEEVVGKNPRLLKSGEQDETFYADLWGTISAGERWHGEFRNLRKDGSFFWEEAYIQAIVGRDGQIKHFIAIKEDIGDRKKAEADLKSLIDEKDTLIQELYHRTRNNLQTVNALLFMKTVEQAPPDARELATCIENWVFALAMVQEELYSSQNLSNIKLRPIAESIAAHTIQSRRNPERNAELFISIPESLIVPLGVANALGLALQELTALSIESFSESVDIRIDASAALNSLTLSYSVQRRSGLRAEERSPDFFSKTLAESLVVEQLRGTFETAQGNGAVCLMTVPLDRQLHAGL